METPLWILPVPISTRAAGRTVNWLWGFAFLIFRFGKLEGWLHGMVTSLKIVSRNQ